MVLQNADGDCRSEVIDAHTFRHAAHAAEFVTGELAIAITQREPRSQQIAASRHKRAASREPPFDNKNHRQYAAVASLAPERCRSAAQ